MRQLIEAREDNSVWYVLPEHIQAFNDNALLVGGRVLLHSLDADQIGRMIIRNERTIGDENEFF